MHKYYMYAAVSPGTSRLYSLGSNQPSASYITAPPRPHNTHEQTLCNVSLRDRATAGTREDATGPSTTHTCTIAYLCPLMPLSFFPFLYPTNHHLFTSPTHSYFCFTTRPPCPPYHHCFFSIILYLSSSFPPHTSVCHPQYYCRIPSALLPSPRTIITLPLHTHY